MTAATSEPGTSSYGPALAMLDIDDIPRGFVALDLLVKEAEVSVYSAGTVQAGRYLILFGGPVAAVEMSFDRALSVVGGAARALVDAVLLPHAEARIAPAALEGVQRWPSQEITGDTLGVFQSGSSPTMLRCMDAALKGALVELVQLRIAEGLGGRAIATLWGETHDVEAAIELAQRVLINGQPRDWSAQTIRNVDPTVAERVGRGTHFFQEWRG